VASTVRDSGGHAQAARALPAGASPRVSHEEFMSENIKHASNATVEKDVIQPATIKHVSDATFEKDVLQSATPVLVDYWAEWCGPCKMIAPVLEDMAKEYAGRLTVAKLDIDANPEITSQFGIRGIPTLILFKSGKPHAQKVGALSKSQLAAFVDSNL
jgi:thioredoxin 1